MFELLFGEKQILLSSLRFFLSLWKIIQSNRVYVYVCVYAFLHKSTC